MEQATDAMATVAENQATTPATEATQATQDTQAQPTEGATTPSAEAKEKTYTQKDFDDAMAKTRGATERELLKLLGAKDKSEISKYTEAYQSRMTAEEKAAADLLALQEKLAGYETQAQQAERLMSVMSAMQTPDKEQAGLIVKMASGLVTEDTSFDEAIKTVLPLFAPKTEAENKEAKEPTLPSGMKLQGQSEDAPPSTLDPGIAGFLGK